MVEEIFPYTSEFSYNLVTVMNEEDIAESGFTHSESLLDKRNKLLKNTKQPSKEAES